jgi:hypothetical protein
MEAAKGGAAVAAVSCFPLIIATAVSTVAAMVVLRAISIIVCTILISSIVIAFIAHAVCIPLYVHC